MARKKVDKFKLPRRFLVVLSIFVVLAGAALLFRTADIGDQVNDLWRRITGDEQSLCCEDHQVLAPHNVPLIAFVVRDIWRDGRPAKYALPERMQTPAQAVYVGLVSDGNTVAETWVHEGTTLEALATGINQARGLVPQGSRSDIDSLEIFLGHSFRRVRDEDYDAEIFSNRHRGIRALKIQYDDKTAYFSPIASIRNNVGAQKFVDAFADENGFDRKEVIASARFSIFDGEQILVNLGRRPKGAMVERGNKYISVRDVTPSKIRESVALSAHWMANNMSYDGRLAYGYYPSKRKPWSTNNMIRQWMATIALGRNARVQIDPTQWERAERNLNHNLRSYFHLEDNLGVIYLEPEDVKLGAVALAALALEEHHNRTRYTDIQQALSATVDALWQPDGRFKTFLRPKRRTDNKNFYPGEALNYWAALYERERNPALLERFMTSFRYYREWHLNDKNRNPAFVPWHTQAYFRVWKLTGDPELRDFIFEMNDWLLGVQQWAIPYEYRDTMGRFYDPGRPFGPPHASSTAVYIEGLIDAFELARLSRDEERTEAYRLAILRGLRSLLQLQFQDDVDMFYIPPGFRKYVHGGFRTRVYDNSIRIDNVQHTMMGMIKVLKTFRPDDYVYPEDRP